MDNKILKDNENFFTISTSGGDLHLVWLIRLAEKDQVIHIEKSLKISLIGIFEHLAGAQLNNWRQNKNENKTRNT